MEFASHIGLVQESAKDLLLCSTFLSVAKLPTDELCYQNKSLNPWFITGFTDAEGSFLISINKKKLSKTGFEARVVFQLCLHKRDRKVLERIKTSLSGVGNITDYKDSVKYYVNSIKDLAVVINHFDKYLLITQKRADFELFKQAFEIILRKEHLDKKGLEKLVALKVVINKGITDELKVAFPNIIPVSRPLVVNQEIKNPNWLAGFVAGEGCFCISIFKDTTNTGFTVKLIFIMAQHSRDAVLMQSLVSYLDCGRYTSRSSQDAGDFIITKFSDMTDKIIPFFDKYPIIGVKSLDFADFKKVAEIMQTKGHLTESGLAEIRLVKAGMNRGRLFETINQGCLFLDNMFLFNK